MVGDPGVLSGVRCFGVAKLPLHRGQVADFLDQMLAHGMVSAVRVVVFNTGEPTDLVPGGVDYIRVPPTVAMDVGCQRKKQRRRAPFFKILCPLLFNVILDRR